MFGKLAFDVTAYCLSNFLTPRGFGQVRCTSRYWHHHLGVEEQTYFQELYLNKKESFRKKGRRSKIYERASVLGDNYKLFYESIVRTLRIQKNNKLLQPSHHPSAVNWAPRPIARPKKQARAQYHATYDESGAPVADAVSEEEEEEEEVINGGIGVTPANYVDPDTTQLSVTNVSSKVVRKGRICLTPGFHWNEALLQLNRDVLTPFNVALAPHENIPLHLPTLIKEVIGSEGQKKSSVRVVIHKEDRKKARMLFDERADIASQLNECMKLLDQVKDEKNKFVEIAEALREHWPNKKMQFADLGPNGEPRGKVTVSAVKVGILKSRLRFNEKVWAQLDGPAQRALLRAQVVYQEEGVTSGPKAIVSRKRKVRGNTLSITSVGSGVPEVTRFYTDNK